MAGIASKRTVAIGDDSFDVAATLGAGVTYAEEFRGKVKSPYTGLLSDDMLVLFRRCNPKKMERDGEESKWVDNDEFEGIEANVDPLLRMTWAMCHACGGTRLGWAKFREMCLACEFVAAQLGALYDTIVNDLGNGVIFRLPEGQTGVGAPDEEQEG